MNPPEDAVAASTLTGTSLPIAGEATLRRYARSLLRRHRAAFAIVIGAHAVAAAAGLVGPIVLGGLVQGLATDLSSARVDLAAGIFLVALVIQTVFTRITRLRSGILGEEVLADLREDFLGRAVNLPTGVVERAGTGDLVSRTTTDVDRLNHAVRDAVPEIVIACITGLFVGGALVITAPQLAVVWLLSVPLIVVSSRWYFKRAPQSYRAESATYAAVQLVDRRDGRRRPDHRALPPRPAARRGHRRANRALDLVGALHALAALLLVPGDRARLRDPARRRAVVRRLAGGAGHDLDRPAHHRAAAHADARGAARPRAHVV